MPKEAEYQVTWSDTLQGYEVIHGMFCFSVGPDGLQPWLGWIGTFRFQVASGESITLRKETKQRGTAYWVAYKRVRGTLRKRYIGNGSKLTIARLEALVQSFLDDAPGATGGRDQARQRAQEQQQHAPPPPPPRKPTLVFTKTLDSALAIFGFSTIPARAEFIKRHRELVKQHHPDVGGLHQDMVAVNLAYDFLKRYVIML